MSDSDRPTTDARNSSRRDHNRRETKRPKKPRKRNRRAARPAPRVDLFLALGLWGLAFLHRVLFLLSNVDRSWGFSVFYEGDSETFYNFARAILAGVPYDAGIPFHPPLWPYVLSLIHSLAGAGGAQAQVPHLQVKLATAAIGAGAVPLLFLLVRRYLGRGIALVSALAAVYSFGLCVVSIAPVTESLYIVLLLSTFLTLSAVHHPLAPPSSGAESIPGGLARTGWVAALGLLLGLLCLTRAEGALIAVFIIGLGAAGELTRRRSRTPTRTAGPGGAGLGPVRTVVGALLPWLGCTAVLLLVLTPWTIRNSEALEKVNTRFATRMAAPLPTFVPITAYGPLNFALANNELADGSFSRAVLTSRAESATLDVTDPQHLEYFLHGYRIGFDWIRSNPGDFVSLVVRKWELFLGAGSLGWTQWNLPGGLNGVRRPVDLFVPDSKLGAWILFPLVLLGCVELLRADGAPRRWGLVVLLTTGAGLITTGLFFGYARLGVVVLPFWISGAAAGLVSVIQRLRRPSPDASLLDWTPHLRSNRERIAWLLPLALLLLVEVWGATGDRNFNASGTQSEGASHLNPHDTMRLEVISKP